jgi:hypothetical protein
MAGDDLRRKTLASVEVPDADLALGIEADEAVAGKLDVLERGSPRGSEELLDAPLAKDVDLPRAEFALAGADGEEGLDGVVSKAASSSGVSAS